MGLVRFQLAVVGELDKHVAPPQLSRRSAAEIIHHGYGGCLLGHFQESLPTLPHKHKT